MIRKKVCCTCKEPLLVSQFSFNRSKPDGLSDQCKGCKKESQDGWYENHADEQNARVQRARNAALASEDPTFGKHTCRKCHKTEPEVRFHRRRVDGKYYKRHLCHLCIVEYRKQFPKAKRNRDSANRSKRERRRDPKRRAGVILTDARIADKRKQRDNDLDLQFISGLINDGCQYCGERELLIGLDRIDNSVGHTKANVIAACSRCNWFRRDMPFAAWIKLSPVLREIREAGLFGNWVGGNSKRKYGPKESGLSEYWSSTVINGSVAETVRHSTLNRDHADSSSADPPVPHQICRNHTDFV